MQSAIQARGRYRKWFSRRFSRFLKSNRGNIAIMFALMAPMFVGGLGLGVETGLWYVDQRNLKTRPMQRRLPRVRMQRRPTTATSPMRLPPNMASRMA